MVMKVYIPEITGAPSSRRRGIARVSSIAFGDAADLKNRICSLGKEL